LARTCKGICVRYECPKTSNRLRYRLGYKRCTHCGIFITTEDARCPCCKAVLRTKARNRSKEPLENVMGKDQFSSSIIIVNHG